MYAKRPFILPPFPVAALFIIMAYVRFVSYIMFTVSYMTALRLMITYDNYANKGLQLVHLAARTLKLWFVAVSSEVEDGTLRDIVCLCYRSYEDCLLYLIMVCLWDFYLLAMSGNF